MKRNRQKSQCVSESSVHVMVSRSILCMLRFNKHLVSGTCIICTPLQSPPYLSVHGVALLYRVCLLSLWLYSVLWNLSLIPPPIHYVLYVTFLFVHMSSLLFYTYKIMWHTAWSAGWDFAEHAPMVTQNAPLLWVLMALLKTYPS